ncbi:MAG TPA: SAM-dependent methyltransferase [Ottowia sp.]|uniref:SAM-dependent methyltransferase n=1 Tax=Ottowia sp. TaxID=1898956 RepID=UPI002C50A0B1|nr:SAM-dependent methyltransferase [Ottowia sp.]HMN21519.1 SAM-dependent methyltransferase [Ottowia sp.]
MQPEHDTRESGLAGRHGCLYLVPGPLDHGCASQAPLTDVLPQQTLAVAARLTHWISENARSTRAFLKRVDALVPLARPLQEIEITELPRAAHKHGDHGTTGARFDARALLAPALEGHDIGLASEAGMPAIADPGSSVVRAAHVLGLAVRPLVGPVSLLLALAASGLNGQNFAFVGYLPQQPEARQQRIRALEQHARRSGQTQLFIEAPYRNRALLQALLQTLQPDTRLAVASGLTLPEAQVRSEPVQQWRRQPALASERLPAIFAIGA